VVGGESTTHLPLAHLALVLGGCPGAVCQSLRGPPGLPPSGDAGAVDSGHGARVAVALASDGWQFVGSGLLVPLHPAFWVYLTMLTAVRLVTMRRWRTADLVPVAVMSLWLALSLWRLRAVSDAVLLTGPCVAAGLGAAGWHRRRWPGLVGIGLTLGLTALVISVTAPRLRWASMGLRYEAVCLRAALELFQLSGRVYSDELDLWLLYRFHPRKGG